MQILPGIIFLLLPFLFLGIYKFEYILVFTIVFHFIIAVITQSLHVFNYPTIITIYTVVTFFALWKIWERKINPLKKLPQLDWTLIVVAIIALICLGSVHYNYSGKYSILSTNEPQQIKGMVYPYPYYADEWYSVSFIKETIASESLPLSNPLLKDKPFFKNFEFAFHSFLSEIVLILNINPIKIYSVLAILSGLLTCILVYLFLKRNNVQDQSAGLAALSVLYITNGAILPGIWYLIPFNLGIILMLLSFLFIDSGNKKMIFFMTMLTVLFYPPLFIFHTVATISFFLTKKDGIRNIIYYCVSILFIGIILYFFSGTENIKNLFFSKILYQNYTPGIHQLAIWDVLPVPILIPAVIGIFITFKKKLWLTNTLLLGLLYWSIYPLTSTRFIIEYQRVVIFTAILFTIYAGFFLNYCVNKINKFKVFQIIIIIFFLFFSFTYTKNNSWEKLIVYDKTTDTIFLPAAPANMYLQQKDLEVFKNIKKKNFLSPPWKGTTIGIATDNYPTETKAGTITHNSGLFRQFISSDCAKKQDIVQKYDIDYIYSVFMECEEFDLLGSGADNLFLYKANDF